MATKLRGYKRVALRSDHRHVISVGVMHGTVHGPVVDFVHGEPAVASLADQTWMSPAEARRVAKALVLAADRCEDARSR